MHEIGYIYLADLHIYIYFDYNSLFVFNALWFCCCSEYESEFIKRIIEEISSIKSIHIKLPIAKYPVEVDSQAEAIESLLDVESNGVFMVGIYGLGGVGKTTISKAVYNRINDCFEGSCFLENVRENSKTNAGIVSLVIG